MSIKSFFASKAFPLFLAISAFSIPLSLAAPSLAIPKDEAISKLKSVSVYVLVKSDDEFLLTENDQSYFVNIFHDESMAQEELKALKALDPMMSGSVKTYTLDGLFPIMETTQDDTKDSPKPVLFPLLATKENAEKALEILRSDGMSDDQIVSSLRMPVFFTDPMVTMERGSTGRKQYFFLDYADLQSILNRLPSVIQRPKVKVLNLDQVLEVIIDKSDDLYEFYSPS